MNDVLGLSFDYDGCTDFWETDSVDENRQFFNDLVRLVRCGSYHTVVILIGSNRQSHATDFLNRTTNNNGSIFTSMIQIHDYFKANLPNITVELNTALLEDLFLAGTDSAFQRGTKLLNGESCTTQNMLTLYGCKEGYLFEENKTLITYYQMQMLAEQYKNDSIMYMFFDDKCIRTEDYQKTQILNNLEIFYINQPSLIPSNTVLSLNYHECAMGNKSSLRRRSEGVSTAPSYKPINNPIQGRGRFNSNYKRNLKDISLSFLASGVEKMSLKHSFSMQGVRQLASST